MIAATICYRQGINVEYYLSHHVPLSEKLMVPMGIQRAEIRRFLPGPDGTPPPYALTTTLYFDSLEIFQAAMQAPVMAELFADVKNFYHSEPEVFVSEVLQNTTY